MLAVVFDLITPALFQRVSLYGSSRQRWVHQYPTNNSNSLKR